MARILTLLPGTISARSNNDEVVMACSIPMVQSYFNISDLQRWITTLEETMGNEKSIRRCILGKNAHDGCSNYWGWFSIWNRR